MFGRESWAEMDWNFEFLCKIVIYIFDMLLVNYDINVNIRVIFR